MGGHRESVQAPESKLIPIKKKQKPEGGKESERKKDSLLHAST